VSSDRGEVPGPEAPWHLRPGSAADLAAIADLHAVAFPEVLLTRLGRRVVRAHYAEILGDPGRVFLVAGRGGRMAGFVACYLDPAGFARRLESRRLAQAWAMIPGLVRRPWLAMAVAGRSLRRRRRRGSAAPSPQTLEIGFLAVHPDSGRRGLGRLLVATALAEGTARGARAARLFVGRDAGGHVGRLYESLGFARTRVRDGDRDRLEEFVLELPASSRGCAAGLLPSIVSE